MLKFTGCCYIIAPFVVFGNNFLSEVIFMQKTNAVRMLEKEKIDFKTIEYIADESDLSGVHTAEVTGQCADVVFKTLVTRSASGCFVFCIPVEKELDLKKAACAAGVKKLEMLPQKELLPTTGYIRGGCSPIGMKKKLPTFIHSSAQNSAEISVSGGARGLQLVINPQTLCDITAAKFADITVSKD